MDPLSILSVVAATIQFVDFGQRLFSETWQIYRSASGQTLQVQNLSTISSDLSRLSTGVKDAFQSRQKNHSGLQDADKELLRLCGECDAIASKILTVLPKVSTSFQSELAQDKQAVERAWLGSFEPRSAGECFRAALRSWWQREEIVEISDRLEKVRQGMMMAATMSIWANAQSTKDWEHQFSRKLDTMIGMLSQALKTSENAGPEQKRTDSQKSVEKGAVNSIRQNDLTAQIIKRIWSSHWKFDRNLLASFPRQTDLSAEQLKSIICESLRFDSMDNREEAIAKTFDCTFRWVFDRNPQVSPEGVPMWSSLPDWLEGDSGLPYWITGKPGSGKSTMMKFILHHEALDGHLQKWSRGSPLYKIKYYAWKPGAEMARSVDGLLRTLLHQVLAMSPGMTPYICPRRWSLFHAVRDMESFPPWTTWELEESFARLLNFKEGGPRLILFIDGLDEFDIAPVDLCQRIQSISAHRTVKVCVASRPWPQFSDAFASSPGLQMHLLTDADIQAFVRGHFLGVVAFQELNDLYRGGGDQLLEDIVKKAKGVFLWTALVTQTLLENLVDGSSLPHLKAILDTMPSEIENLYDAIYAAIPRRLLPEVSATLQLYVLASQPLDWMTFWLADETRGGSTAIHVPSLDMDKVQASVKRRLGARTRGILELVPRTQTIEYLHRTAAEWVNQPRVWEKLKSVSPPDLDPHYCLLQAEAIQGENWKPTERFFLPGSTAYWKDVTKGLHYASHIDPAVISDSTLTIALDRFHDACAKRFTTFIGLEETDSSSKLSWASYQPMKTQGVRANTFNGLTAQFAIVPYIRHKFKDKTTPFHPVPQKRSIALLEQAIFGPGAYSAPGALTVLDQPNLPKISYVQRLQAVSLLLERGVRQPGIVSMVKEHECDARSRGDGDYGQYLNDVLQLLVQHRATTGEKRSYMKRLFRLD
ncbi:hypothetical protein NCS56_00909800 [Fusarium sp. Ph1]|nr:hypothetical protein NCS56_00909800 [Fusarium sp. Ph1]